MSDYAPYTLAGAFLVGAIVGVIACIRIFRLVLAFLRKQEKD